MEAVLQGICDAWKPTNLKSAAKRMPGRTPEPCRRRFARIINPPTGKHSQGTDADVRPPGRIVILRRILRYSACALCAASLTARSTLQCSTYVRTYIHTYSTPIQYS